MCSQKWASPEMLAGSDNEPAGRVEREQSRTRKKQEVGGGKKNRTIKVLKLCDPALGCSAAYFSSNIGVFHSLPAFQ